MKLTEKQRRELDQASGIGKSSTFPYPSGETASGLITDEVAHISGHYKAIIQQIKPDGWDEYDDGSRYVYRFAYYVYSFKKKGVVWANRPFAFTTRDCQKLFVKARKRGWELFEA